ncbi:beta-propeller domain-containing protein [Hamadaea tsunoensis]|uniref:beta-propeller domain-containing protein n=1 Tax=Hamadaea tsunoensis TaxID=53368 RepID=UPI000489C035|nr:beta-propeller domain-containing protein [Hamadaea tsunoensis]
MTRRLLVPVLLGGLLLAGCGPETVPPAAPAAPAGPAPELRLVAYDSCEQLVDDVRSAAKASVQPWGLGDQTLTYRTLNGAGKTTDLAAVPGAAPGGDVAYSGTNVNEAGVDEPDLVKTDGRRIVVANKGRLRVIDPRTHAETGSLPLAYNADQLLLSGDHVLAIGGDSEVPNLVDVPMVKRPYFLRDTVVQLISLTGTPTVLSTYRIEASMVDARQIGSTARIVVKNAPRIVFKPDAQGSRQQLIAANRKIIDKAPLEAWLPAYTSDGVTGKADCGDVTHPPKFSGASLVSILSFDLGADRLGDGAVTSVFADAQTVYGSGPNLYLAHDQRWLGASAQPRTELYRFDVTGRKPVFTASGTVPGWLLNQYALSEYDQVLRVAATTGQPWTGNSSSSSVYTLKQDGGNLKIAGTVGGLGKGEQIYAVRFVGPQAYVVTFRRTDPLFTIDLRDPAHPAVAGELKVPGYSSYLHPVDGGRLIGIGQDATDKGVATGTQISLFDVADPDKPARLAQLTLGFGWSGAEYDPHAFLYWPDAHLLVIPATTYTKEGRPGPDSGVLLVRVGATSLTKLGWIKHEDPASSQYPIEIQRSLVVGDELWTVSGSGLLASTLTGSRIAWIR